MAGQIITDGNGNYKKLVGGAWVDTDPPAGGPVQTGGGRGAQQDIKFMNDLSTAAEGARQSSVNLTRAKKITDRANTGVFRGALMSAATPDASSDGFWNTLLDRVGSAVVGVPARLSGAVTQQDVDDYKRMRAIQGKEVLTEQMKQRGTQTNRDAALIASTTFDPSNSRANNTATIDATQADNRKIQARAIFYTQFAKKFGLHGTSPHGYTADQIWANMAPQLTKQILGQQNNQAAPTIKVISRTRVK